jgi:amidase
MIDAGAIIGHAESLGLKIGQDAAAMAAEIAAGLTGQLPDDVVIDESRPPVCDPLSAIARVIDRDQVANGPLSDMRLAVKDNIAVANVATAIGSGLPGFVGRRDATVVHRAAAAGAHIVAKAQCEAFLLGANSFSSRPLPVRNPHHTQQSAGGSSSGSAAMVAAGLCDIALGSDGAGSIRIPASHCGIVGLQTSRGAVPFSGAVPLAPFLEGIGPMGRNVASVALLFDAIAGPDGIDPRSGWGFRTIDRPVPRRLTEVKIGIVDSAIAQCDSAVQAVFSAAERAITAGGAQCHRFDWHGFAELPPLHLAIYLISDALSGRGQDATLAPSLPDGWAAWRDALSPDAMPPLVVLSHAVGLALHTDDPGLIGRCMGRAMALAAELDGRMADIDCLILPVTPQPPQPIPLAEATTEEVYGDTTLTAAFNATGHPVVSLPAGMAEGLPVGIQIVGHHGGDRQLLHIATLIERQLGTATLPTGEFGQL